MNPRRAALPAPELAPTAVQARDSAGPDVAQARRAMAANAFRLMQEQGLVAPQARLDEAAPGGSRTYRERMEALVTDRNADGRLELDLAQLRDSGLVRTGTTVEQLDRVLAADVRQSRLTDTFLQAQHPRVPGLTAQDQRDLRASEGIRLRNPNAWGLSTYDSVADVRAAAVSEGAAAAISRDALMTAQVMRGRGDLAGARALLARTGQGLQENHHFTAARATLTELTRPPLSEGEVNLVQDRVDALRRRDPGYDRRQHVITVSNDLGNRTDIRETAFGSTFGALAQRRLAQMSQVERMEAALGARVEPTNIEQAQDYFQRYSRTHTSDEVRQEYGAYLQNFYAHAGQGVTWNALDPVDQRPNQLTQSLAQQPTDASGRRLIDCEGFIYLNHRLLTPLQDAQGRRRFDVVHGGNGAHVISMAQDRTGHGFVIDNSSVGPMLDRPALAQAAEGHLPQGRFSRRLSDVDEQGTLLD
ncbi:MAG: hypothetical protein JNK82_14935 [Myxococcaceae bacterium]|nr:hypothetical protein [Myxococcaceae bacterium]